MSRFDGSLARALDFGESTTTSYPGAVASLRLASSGTTLRGPDKYKILETRRRRAQISARRALDLLDTLDPTPGGEQ